MNFTQRQKNMATFLLYFAFAAVIIFLIFALGKYIVPLIVPFIVAWVIALILQPAINFITKHTKIPRSVATFLILLFLSGIIIFLGYLLIKELINELSALSAHITTYLDALSGDEDKLTHLVDKINSFIPFFDASEMIREYLENLDENLVGIIRFIGTNISSSILPFLSNAITFVADFFVVSIISLVAIYYIAVDFRNINSFILYQFPKKTQKSISFVKVQFFSTIWKYLKAYSLIIVITFTELVIAFYVLGIPYPFLVALITALVDILPIIGTGTILVPWSVFLIASGNLFTGIGLLVTYIIITVLRQIIEPKIVGSYIGMYPLITLVMMYAGLKAFGILGLFAFPILSIIIKNLNDSGSITLWKYPEGMKTGNEPPHSSLTTLKERLVHPLHSKESSNNLSSEQQSANEHKDSNADDKS